LVREWGVGTREWGMENGEWRMGSGECGSEIGGVMGAVNI